MTQDEAVAIAIVVAFSHHARCTDPEVCVDDPADNTDWVGCIQSVRREVQEAIRFREAMTRAMDAQGARLEHLEMVQRMHEDMYGGPDD